MQEFVSKKNILENFPFSQFRGHQEKALNELSDALNNPQIKYIVMESPVGSGKSGMAIALARSVTSSYILTANKILQDQYGRDFSNYISDLRGRNNYKCLKFSGSCSTSCCRDTPESRNKCAKDKACEYHFALEDATKAQITSLNFAAAIAFLNYTEYFQSDRNLMIVDEAHLMQDNLTSFVEFAIAHDVLYKLVGINRPELAEIPYKQNISDYIDWLKDLRLYMKDKASTFTSDQGIDEKLGIKITIEMVEGFAKKLDILVNEMELDISNFVFEIDFDAKTNTTKRISFRPIDVGKYAKSLLFDHAQKTVMMSATIINYKEFIKQLDIPENECIYISVDSTFPKENRPILRNYIDSFNYKNIDMNMPKIIKECESYLNSHKDEKGIIHTHSYSNAKTIYEALKDKFPNRLLFPTKSFEQKEILMKHTNSIIPTVLISPSMTEGVDLKDDLSRFQIIVKVPYPSLGDKIVKARMERNKDWYSYKTALTIIQAYGRSTRSETDHSVTYIIDANFEKLIQFQKKSLPKWFLEAII